MTLPDSGPEHGQGRSEPHKTTNPLIWIVLILALLATCWFAYHHMRASGVDTSAPIDGVPADISQPAANQAPTDADHGKALEPAS